MGSLPCTRQGHCIHTHVFPPPKLPSSLCTALNLATLSNDRHGAMHSLHAASLWVCLSTVISCPFRRWAELTVLWWYVQQWPVLPVICQFSLSETQKIGLKVRNFSICAGTSGNGPGGLLCIAASIDGDIYCYLPSSTVRCNHRYVVTLEYHDQSSTARYP